MPSKRSTGEFFGEMPPSGGERPRQRNAAATAVFKYGGSEVTDDGRDGIVVYYWSAPDDENVRNASGDLRLPQQRWTGVTAGQQQQQQQIRQPATSSFTESSVHSAALVLTIAGIMCLLFQLCVSRRRRKMYCGHARLCVCLCVCPRPYAHTTARTRM